MVCAQLFAFGRVSQRRAEGRERRERKREERRNVQLERENNIEKNVNGGVRSQNGDVAHRKLHVESSSQSSGGLDDTEDEIIL